VAQEGGVTRPLSAERQAQRAVELEVVRRCLECGRLHDQAVRSRVLRRLLPSSAQGIREALSEGWPCFYGETLGNNAGARRLQRDLHSMGAVVVGLGNAAMWSLR
jgi:hypothetical protein